MSSVDDRIVNMKFNNAQFTQGVDKSKRDLTGLEKTITSAGKSKGLTDMASSVEKATGKFSAMKIAGVAAIATIASKATSIGLNLLKGFTIDPIMDGFREYTTGLNSVQTIMANTGKAVGPVNKALDQLNTYADQTIYNFGEMAKNVGTFTAAGVDLKTSVDSIKGIANLAAMSGSNSQQASTAMYQLSQAISAGRVGLQDWNSVVNAGMGGKIFQTALSRTAMNMGTLTKGAVSFEGQLKKLTVNGVAFRQSISALSGESWLTGDVLVDTLKQISGGYTMAELKAKGFSKAQRADIQKLQRDAFDAATKIKTLPQLIGVIKESIGSTFASAFRTIMGDFEQSKKLWSDVAYAIMGPYGFLTKMQNGVTGMIQAWADKNGRRKVLNSFKNTFEGLGRVVGAFRDAFGDIFPKGSSNIMIKMSRLLRDFSKNLIPSKDTVKSLRSIFGGFFAVLHIGLTIVTGIAKAFGNLFAALFHGSDDARGGVLSFAGSIGEVLIALDKWLTQGGKFSKFMSNLGTVVGSALAPVVGIIGLVVKAFASLASGQGVGGVMSAIDGIKILFLGLVEDILGGLARITAPFEQVSSFFSTLQDKVAGMSGSFEAAIAPFSAAGGVAGGGLGALSGTLDRVASAGENVGKKLSDSFDKVRNSSVDVKDSTEGMYESVAGAGASAATSSMAAVSSRAEQIGSVFSKIGDILKKVGGGIASALGWMVEKLSNIPFPDDALEWATVLNMLISGALIKRLFFSKGLFSTMKDTFKEMGKAFSKSMGEVTKTMQTMQGAIKSEIIKNIAIAVALLVASLIALSFIPHDKLAQGLGALATTMAMAGLMMKVMLKGVDDIDAKDLIKKGGAMLSIGAAMVLMATSVAILTGAVAALAFIPFDKLKQGLGAVAALLAMLTASLVVLKGNGPAAAAVGGAMLMMALSIDALVLAVTALGLLPLDVLKQGLGAVAAGLGMMTVALLVLTGTGPQVLAAGGAMVMMAFALDTMVGAIAILGALPWDVVEQGLKAVAIGLGIMTLSLLLLSGAGPQVLAAGAAMVMMAFSLNMLLAVILALGAAPLDVVNQGLTAMGIALALLVGAGAIAMLIIPGLTALSIVILSIGAAMLMAGTGMALFVGALALLVAVGVAAIGIITLAISAFIALLPSIAIQMAAAFVSFVQAIALAAPKLRKAFGKIFSEMIGTVEDAIPRLGDLLQTMINTGIGILEESIPRWVEMGFTVIDEFMKSADRHIPSIVDSAIDLVTKFLDELGSHTKELANAGLDLVVDIMDGITDAIENSDKVRTAARKMATTFVDELRETLADLIPDIPIPDIPLPPGVKQLVGALTRTVKGGPPAVGQKKTLADQLQETGVKVAQAVEGALRLLVGAVTGPLYQLANSAAAAKRTATQEGVRAEQQDISANTAVEGAQSRIDKARDIKNKEKRKKQLKAAQAAMTKAMAQRRAADAQAQKAAMAQIASDYKAQQSSDAITYKDDAKGLGDAKSQQGQNLADSADQLLASAQAKAGEITRLEGLAKQGGKNAKKYRDQAAQLRKEAANETAQSMLLANQAIEAQTAAVQAYAEARKLAALDAIDRMAQIRQEQDAIKADKAWQKDYDAATDEGKIWLLQQRAAANEKKAADAAAAMDSALAQGAALKAYIDAGNAVSEQQLADVTKAMENAEEQAAIAAAAADAAKADRETIDQLQTSMASNNSSGGGANITPSRTALEDAALAVDRYTTSVAQAEEMAMAGSTTTQFVQNNYSPEALPASTLYRNGKNLIAAAEVKMGAND